MLRFVLYFSIICAVLWMAIPLIATSGTEMAGPPGGPDPNTYNSDYQFGFPLSWMSMSRSWNESTGVNTFSFDGFKIVGLAIHLATLFVPTTILVWINTRAKQ